MLTILGSLSRFTGNPVVIRPERRDEDWPPENLLIKWRSHAGCGFNLSTMCLLGHLPLQQTNDSSRTGSFGFWRMTGISWVGAIL